MEPKPPRRRGRTTLIVGVAALLGAVAGTATGYTIQADRPPTALPPLSQPGLAYPAKALPAGTKVKALSAEEDSQVRTDGDLRKLLLGKPEGVREAPSDYIVDGWSQLPLYTGEAERPSAMFGFLAGLDFRRVAATSWDQPGDHVTNIDLVQFGPGPNFGARDLADDQTAYSESLGGPGEPIKNSSNGHYWVFKARHEAGFLPYYARALAHRGDVVVDINIFDSKPIAASEIRDLAERQLERL
ncbi:hypothetical protein [Streptomyces liangshanensis]|uniref:Uncharacterized protein n=1 Tax=Streptomyces liangshanensis TaxID=2717324 RepID=A0A6G9H0S4_9ACTN|nr:hypothetical protein [Streptomyces liangshanensis]QIQ04070.1 hypothetical protein HA039_18695 [Streptomyces liangshanensis]